MEIGLNLMTAVFVSLGWAIYVFLLARSVRSKAREARTQLDTALQRARDAESVANDLNGRILRAEAALNADTDLPSAAQAARIILFAATTPPPKQEA